MARNRLRPDSMDGSLTFGAMLKDLRRAAGLTQEELAARARLSAKAISALERGVNSRPTQRDLVAPHEGSAALRA